MSLDSFWKMIDEQIGRLRTATTVDEVLAICPTTPHADGAADGFFAGGGGDETVYGALIEAGWTTVWAEAHYYWCMKSPSGEPLTYVEGDLYRGNQREK